MSHHEKVAVETRKQMLQHQQNNSETSQITSCNITNQDLFCNINMKRFGHCF
jgi:hypothetical protein